MSVTWEGNAAVFKDIDSDEIFIAEGAFGLLIRPTAKLHLLSREDARVLAGICHQYAVQGRIGPVDVPAGSPETQDIRDKMDDMDDGMTRLAARFAEMAVRMDAIEAKLDALGKRFNRSEIRSLIF